MPSHIPGCPDLQRRPVDRNNSVKHNSKETHEGITDARCHEETYQDTQRSVQPAEDGKVPYEVLQTDPSVPVQRSVGPCRTAAAIGYR